MLYRSLLPLALSVSLMAVSGGLKQALAQPKKTPQVDPGAQQGEKGGPNSRAACAKKCAGLPGSTTLYPSVTPFGRCVQSCGCKLNPGPWGRYKCN